MPTLRYKDANGNWVLLAGPDEVAIQDTEPAEHPDLWVDMLAEGAEGGGGGTSDHGALSGLLDDDHTQYAKVTVSTTDPDPVADAPARDGILWITVEA